MLIKHSPLLLMCQLGPSIFLICLSAETVHSGLELKKKNIRENIPTIFCAFYERKG